MSSVRGPLAPIQIRGKLAVVRLGVEPSVVQVVELAVEVDRAVAVPQQPDDVQRLLEAGDRLGEVEAIRHGVLGLAAAEAEDEAALGEVVEGQRGLRQHRRDAGAPCRPRWSTSGTFLVSTAAAAATAMPSRWRCGDGETVARSVNSGVQIESGQKLTM